MELPDTLLNNLKLVHDDAEPWLAALPETLAGLEARWGLRVLGPVPLLSYNLVLYAERLDGTPCILKLSPLTPEMAREGEALSLYAGDGICRLLERDDGVSALLLERILPGLSLQEIWTYETDAEHTRIAAKLMRRLWRPVTEPHPFRPLLNWARMLWEVPGEDELREKAQALLLGLGPDENPVLLHGDLHHSNVLSARSEPYFAIDPKGVVGTRGFDIGMYLLNPLGVTSAELITLLPQRLDIFSEELGVDRRELAAWGFVQAVLSSCWTAEDTGEHGEEALEVARGLESFF